MVDGIDLLARFALKVNELEYCGPKHVYTQFSEYIGGNHDKQHQDDIRNAVKEFRGLYPYLSVIAEKLGKDFLDPEVVEAYWIGNSSLKRFTTQDMHKIVDKLEVNGLMPRYAAEVRSNLPENVVPHHNFHAIYVDVGNLMGAVNRTIQNMDNCKTIPGRLLEILDDKRMLVYTQSLREDHGKLYLADDTKIAVYNPAWLSGIKKGDYVALHWGIACVSLTHQQVDDMLTFTYRMLELENMKHNMEHAKKKFGL